MIFFQILRHQLVTTFCLLNRHSKHSVTFNSMHMCLGCFTSRCIYKSCKVTKNLVQNGTRLTVGHCVHLLTESFQAKGISEPKCSAEYIIAHALGQKTLYAVPRNRLLDESVISKIMEYAEIRKQNLPVQYVLGEWDFMNLTLACTPPVFIPRPETEELVGYALRDPVIQNATHMLEVGCGTGAISIYLLTQLPKLKATAMDVSRKACELTLQNTRTYNVEDRLNIINMRFTSDISLHDIGLEDKVDFMISNPPYVPHHVINNLQTEVTMFEDHRALDGGIDGLSVIRDILQVAALFIKMEGSLWLEVDTSHPSKIESLVNSESSLKLHYVKTYHDFSNSPRICHLKVKSG